MNFKYKCYCILFGLSFLGNVFAQNTPPSITVSGGANYCLGEVTPIITTVSISDTDHTDTSLAAISVQISEGYEAGFDNLFLSETEDNITATWLPNEGKLLLTGPANLEAFENALLNVRFTTSQTLFSTNKIISINLGNANFLPSTGHYYFYEPNFGITWENARLAAQSQNYFGLQGYLATITTPEEAQITGEQSNGAGWIGASDEAIEGTWQWVTGPEAGTIFWQGLANGTPVNGEFSFWNTGEPNNFPANTDEDYAHITDPNVGILGSWNDLPIGGDPSTTSDFHPKGYIVEFGGMPGDPDVNLSVAITITMPQTELPTPLSVCYNTEITLSIITNTDEVLWYTTPTSTVPIHIGHSFTTTLSASTTFWVSSNFLGCTNDNRQAINLTVSPAPEVLNITATQCGYNTTNETSFFNLGEYDILVANGVTLNRTVSYFEDQNLTIPIINISDYQNSMNGQVIYAQVTDTVSGCTAIAEVVLNVSTQMPETLIFSECDDNQADGQITFNLSSYNDIILNNFPDTAFVRYYATINDALLNNSPLPNNYANSINNEVLYARLFEDANCLGIFAVVLTVNPKPILETDQTLIFCERNSNSIILHSGLIDTDSSNYSFLWPSINSSPEIIPVTTPSVMVGASGIYTVEVTHTLTSCTSTRTITVVPSETAIFDSIVVNDISDSNSITVNVSGNGNYEFALDSEEGPYQDSNVFDNVSVGVRTIFVRDKNQCGTVSQEVLVLGYSKFFTPNDDGINDTWGMKGFSFPNFPNTAEVKIFNRYGKLLSILNANHPEWNGMYNGKKLPTSDFWFELTLENGRVYKNHFSLKR